MSNKVYKRIIFHFYAFDGFKENRAIKLHLKCLKRYAKVFDEGIFIIAVDNISNDKLIKDAEHSIIECGFTNIKFIVKQNDAYREAKTFFDEVVQKLKILDGLTFFGHTKGITNYNSFPDNKNDIDAWIVGMYYFNLNFIDEVEQWLVSRTSTFYGAFLHVNPNELNMEKVPAFYCGTFYWLNCQKILEDNGDGAYLPMYNRCYAENYPLSIGRWDMGECMSSHGSKATYVEDIYTTAEKLLYFFSINNEEYKEVIDLWKN